MPADSIAPLKLSVNLILASASPRRADLLQQVGVPFAIVPSEVDESTVSDDNPARLVEKLAIVKAEEVAKRFTGSLVLGADTTVVMNGENVGKPTSEQEARQTLRKHSGKTHTVYTGIALVHLASGRKSSCSVRTDVSFGVMSDSEIDAYVRSGSPMDKAGAYGYQDSLGPLFVESIVGDYYNVIGLPLRTFYLTLMNDFPDLVKLS